jgi:hypothetical protein
MSHELMRRLALVAAFSLFGAVPVAAQHIDRRAEAHHRNQCRLAGQVLTTGHPEPKREWARSYVTMCEEEAPEFFASEWARVEGDTARLGDLVFDSGRIRDERLYEALRSVVSDRSRPELVRVGAMLVLSRYVDPHSAVWFSDLRPPVGEVRHIPLVLSWSTSGNQLNGTRPLGSVAPSVLAALREVAARRDDEPRAVWYAAEVLAKRVRRDIEAGLAR